MDLLLQLPAELLALSQSWFGALWGSHLYILVKTLGVVVLGKGAY